MSNDAPTDTSSSAAIAPIDTRYRDPELPVDERVEILLSQMTVAEKAGLFFQNMITMGSGGTLSDGDAAFGLPSAAEYVLERGMNHFNLFGAAPTAGDVARWHNSLQELAASTRLGIPVTVSSDPRHAFSDNPGAAMHAGPFSQWPEPLGLAATRDAELVRNVRRHRASGVPGGRHPAGAASAGRSRHRAALVACAADLRRGRRALR